jgi:hypothetical protein
MAEPPDSPESDRQQLDVGDVELTSQRDVTSPRPASLPSVPPPLPPEAARPTYPSHPPGGYLPSVPPPPAKRPPIFYAALVAAFVLTGLVVGGVLSMTLRKPKPSETPGPTRVITIPTVDMADDRDAAP